MRLTVKKRKERPQTKGVDNEVLFPEFKKVTSKLVSYDMISVKPMKKPSNTWYNITYGKY